MASPDHRPAGTAGVDHEGAYENCLIDVNYFCDTANLIVVGSEKNTTSARPNRPARMERTSIVVHSGNRGGIIAGSLAVVWRSTPVSQVSIVLRNSQARSSSLAKSNTTMWLHSDDRVPNGRLASPMLELAAPEGNVFVRHNGPDAERVTITPSEGTRRDARAARRASAPSGCYAVTRTLSCRNSGAMSAPFGQTSV